MVNWLGRDRVRNGGATVPFPDETNQSWDGRGDKTGYVELTKNWKCWAWDMLRRVEGITIRLFE
jgi:hypothetical protein